MADDKKSTTTPTAATKQVPISFVVEVATPHLNSYLFPINQRLLRGRWDREKFPRGMVTSDEFNAMPNPLPGMMIEFDSTKRQARIFDVLADDSSAVKAILKKIEEVIKASGVADRAKSGPDREDVFAELEENDLKSWCYHVRRMLDNNCCQVRKGEVPTMKEIEAMPGLVLKSTFDSSPLRTEYQPLPRKYKAPMPDPVLAGDDVAEVLDNVLN